MTLYGIPLLRSSSSNRRDCAFVLKKTAMSLPPHPGMSLQISPTTSLASSKSERALMNFTGSPASFSVQRVLPFLPTLLDMTELAAFRMFFVDR